MMKKADGVIDRVRECLDRREALAASIAGEAAQHAMDKSRLEQIEATVDLSSPAALDDVLRLQAKVALMPRRLPAREALLEACDLELIGLCHRLVSEHLSPVGRDLEDRAAAKARADLKAHFSDAESLSAAVLKSALVGEIQSLRSPVKLDYTPQAGAAGYARELLATPEKFAAFAKKLG